MLYTGALFLGRLLLYGFGGGYMLQFNGKTRKGKAYGLPYQGSKRKIAKRVVEIIKQNFGTTKTVYDIFGGGGAITFECLLNDIDIVYNDNYTELVNTLKWLQTCTEGLNRLIWSREQFMAVRNNSTHPPEEWLGMLINSFGNDMRTYLYSKEKSAIKYHYAKLILDTYGTGINYTKTPLFQQFQEEYQSTRRLESLQRLQQVEALNKTKRVSDLGISRLEFHNLDYKAFSHIEGAIFYLDPPYENTVIQGYKHISEFNSQDFYDWAFEMAKHNDVLISSYHISDPRFECVYEFTKTTSTLQNGNSGRSDKMERLWMVKPDA